MNFAQGGLGSQGPGYVYDPEGGEGPPNFPDVPQLLDDVYKILKHIDNPDLKALKIADKQAYQDLVEKDFPDFSFRYYNLFIKLLSGDDITPLLAMLVAIEKVKSGELTMEEAEKGIGEGLAKKYVLPKLQKK
jgi:hypothetical protein